MSKDDGKVTPAAGSGVVELEREETPRPVVSGDASAEEKPRASEEIVIEEISIDGMCGVY